MNADPESRDTALDMEAKILPSAVWYPLVVVVVAAPTAIAVALAFVAGSAFVVPLVLFLEIALIHVSWKRYGRRLIERQVARGHGDDLKAWATEQVVEDEGIKGMFAGVLALAAMFVSVPVALFSLAAAIVWG